MDEVILVAYADLLWVDSTAEVFMHVCFLEKKTIKKEELSFVQKADC